MSSEPGEQTILNHTARLIPLQEKASVDANDQTNTTSLCRRLGGEAEVEQMQRYADQMPDTSHDLVTPLGKSKKDSQKLHCR